MNTVTLNKNLTNVDGLDLIRYLESKYLVPSNDIAKILMKYLNESFATSLTDAFNKIKSHNPNIKLIECICCRICRIELQQLQQKTKKYRIVRVRYLIMYIISHTTLLSDEDIARMYRKNRSMMFFARKRINQYIDDNLPFKDKILKSVKELAAIYKIDCNF